jgi:hypothetical protein
MQKRLLAMLQPRRVATTRRLSDRPRFIALRTEVADHLHSLLHLPGAPPSCCQHRLFFSQVELCDNLIFFPRAAVDQFAERLLDMNRTIGQPKKITLIFGRKVTRQYKGKLQTELEDLDLPNPVIRSHYAHGFAKQYVRDDRLLRTEPATNDVTDYGVNKNVENLPLLRQRMSEIIDHYHDAQQDILQTFIDRGPLQRLAQPTTLTNGKRIPGLKLDHPRQLAVMHALVR